MSGPSPRPKQHHSPDLMGILPLGKAMTKATPKGPHSLKHQEIMSPHKVLTRSCQEAFGWDTHLVRKTREEYFRNHCPNFNNENTHDLMDVFQHMAKTASLLGSTVYEIQEVWTGQDELQHAYHALRALPKGQKFFWAVSSSESPKAMGLASIHHPNALWCFNGVTHCPGVEKKVRTRAPSSTTRGKCITNWALYVRSVSAACPSCQRLSGTMDRRTANLQQREVLMSHPHQHNHWHKVC